MLKNFIQSLIITSIVCLSSCNLLLGSYIGDKIQYLVNSKVQYITKEPIKIFIDENDNGIIAYKDSIYKIKNLHITDEQIYLNDWNSNSNIENVSYYNDKNGNGILIYSISSIPKYNNLLGFYYSFPKKKDSFLIKIENNKFLQKNKILSNEVIYVRKIFQITTNSYFFLESKGPLISINVIENDKIISSKDIDKDLFYGYTKSLLDKNGNGYLYSFTKDQLRYIYLKNFEFSEFKLSIDVSKIKDLKSLYEIAGFSLDERGNGYMLFIEQKDPLSNKDLYLKTISNFNISNERTLITSNKEIGKVYCTSKNGNGFILFQKIKIMDKDNQIYLYAKKINNFKIESKEIKISDYSGFSYFNLYTNEKGNGLLVLKDVNKDSFIIKKIQNYDI